MTTLKKIQHIKQQKLTCAEIALRKATSQLTKAIAALEEARSELAGYLCWRKEQENKNFQQIQYRQLKVTKVDSIREAIAAMLATEAKKQQHILELEKQKLDCEQYQVECQRYVHHCEKDVEKYVDLIAQYSTHEKLRKERAADLVLDDFALMHYQVINNEHS